MIGHLQTSELPDLQHALVSWFEAHKADLPWRRTKDPYAIWLSEIMLQQTQVTTVIPYFEQFIARFPDVSTLAAAPIDDVLKAWEGLGYYSRARNIYRAAQMIVREFEGQFPKTVHDLQRLPGVGRYTAGAVASLAYGLDVSAVDGNVIRILTRVFDIADDIGQADTKNALWELAERLVPAGQAGPWNEGLMELGRTVCTPTSPNCTACPIVDFCEAERLGVQSQRPVKQPRRKVPHFDVTAAVIRGSDGKLLIAQRPADGMLGGLWEFPGGKRKPHETLPDCLRREIDEELGIEIRVGSQIGTVRHGYSHFRITLYAFECQVVAGKPQAIGVADWAWVTLDEIDRYAFPVTDQKIIGMLRDGGGQLGMDLGK